MRLIRTEYITGLEQIVAFVPEPTVSIERMEAMQLVLKVIASEELAVLVEENPPTVILDETYRNICARTITPKVVEDGVRVWNKLWLALDGSIRDRSWHRAEQSLANIREHARVQLVWAEELTTKTVLLKKEDHQMYLAGLQHIKNATMADANNN